MWEGDLNKKNNKKTTFWTVGHEMNSWKTKKNNKKREARLILTLQYSPICHFYFPGSPLCFSSRRLRLCFPSCLPRLPLTSPSCLNKLSRTTHEITTGTLAVFTCAFNQNYQQILSPKTQIHSHVSGSEVN